MGARGISLRDWTIDRDDYATDEDFRAAVQNELALSEHISHRLGVAILSAPARKRLAGGAIVTRGWVFATRTIPLMPGEPAERPAGRPGRLDEPLPEPTRPMVGVGGEVEDVPKGQWNGRILQGWMFDDEDDGEDFEGDPFPDEPERP